jgi:hypothetical protein
MRLRFIAPGQAGHVCRVFGLAFPHGEWVDASALSPEHLERLAQNPAFEPSDGAEVVSDTPDPGAPPRPRPRRAKAV